MPSFLIPRHVTAHRLAATALYRSLLHQCRRLAPIHGDELQNIVRNRFKQTQHVHSYRRLRLAFQAGYEAIDYLDAAVAGDEESARYLRELVGRAPGKVRKAAEPRPRQQRVTSTTNAPGQGALERELASRPRPLEELSGKRKVPVLYSANKIPILRFTKPQPHSLSRYIANRISQRHKRFDRRDWLEGQIGLARAEDEWDDMMSGSSSLAYAMKGEREGNDEPAWTAELETALEVVEKAVREEGRKNLEMAGRMQGLVDRERGVFEREREARRAKAREGRRERSRERRAASREDGGQALEAGAHERV